jgi:hypothetical protein
MGLKQRETLTNLVVAQNHRTFSDERVFDVQRVTKALCATFCATLGVKNSPSMVALKKSFKLNVNQWKQWYYAYVKQRRETVRNGHFCNFKSCASAISPHRQHCLCKLPALLATAVSRRLTTTSQKF